MREPSEEGGREEHEESPNMEKVGFEFGWWPRTMVEQPYISSKTLERYFKSHEFSRPVSFYM
jgi:hypothetical protein